MSYILVALHDGEDEATQLTLSLAQYIASQEPPLRAYEEAQPSHDAVGETVRALQVLSPESIPSGLLFGHCGKYANTLRAQMATEPVWARAEEFGQLFAGCRVYVFACETIARPDGFEGEATFGATAVEHGVSLFVGHTIPVGAPDIPPHYSPEQRVILQEVSSQVFLAFLRGEDRQKRLRRIVFDAVAVVEEFEVTDSPEEIIDGHMAAGWGPSLLLQQLRDSLIVLPSPG